MASILVFYGSYRSDRAGIRLADYIVSGLQARGDAAELIDAKRIGLPMLDRMYKEYEAGQAPPAIETLAGKIKAADAFIFVVGEYNWGVQPGLKNLTDHFLEEWFWRPAAIASYSSGRLGGARSAMVWHGTLSEMGMVVVSSALTVGPVTQTLDAQGQIQGDAGQALDRSFGRFADDLAWWAAAAKAQRAKTKPPYCITRGQHPRIGRLACSFMEATSEHAFPTFLGTKNKYPDTVYQKFPHVSFLHIFAFLVPLTASIL